MKDSDIHEVISMLEDETSTWGETALTLVAKQTQQDPFRILIGTVLSIRTKDEATAKACERLFKLADNPNSMLGLSQEKVVNAIYPVGFHLTKARNIHEISRILVDNFKGIVPNDIDTLITLPGVGRKTANLVITVGYGKLGICVDTHVHRISNRWGYIATKNPNESEAALRNKLPSEYWIRYNDLLVMYGQNMCKPVSPFCSCCRLSRLCDQIEVHKHR